MAKHVRGVPETVAAMRKLAGLLGPALNEASKRSLEPTAALTKQLAPVDTGTLRRSIVVRRLADSPKTRPEYRVGADPKVRGKDGRRPSRYLHLVELGLGNSPAKPFLTPAWEATRDQISTIFGRTIGPALEKSAARIAARIAKRAGR